jgi:hypothetical protein
MKLIFYSPSFYAHIFNALFILAAIILILFKQTKLDGIKSIEILLLFAIAIGLHGISHLGMEYVYGYNPLRYISTIKYD